jgi:hypothetical protein
MVVGAITCVILGVPWATTADGLHFEIVSELTEVCRLHSIPLASSRPYV